MVANREGLVMIPYKCPKCENPMELPEAARTRRVRLQCGKCGYLFGYRHSSEEPRQPRYRWREANGDEGYDHSAWEHENDCSYCGCPPMYQDPLWSEEHVPGANQCPSCGATWLTNFTGGLVDGKEE
jgi:ribosomal protein S27AE